VCESEVAPKLPYVFPGRSESEWKVSEGKHVDFFYPLDTLRFSIMNSDLGLSRSFFVENSN